MTSYDWRNESPKPGDTIIRLIDSTGSKLKEGGAYVITSVRGNDVYLEGFSSYVWSLCLFKPLTAQTANYQIF